MLHRDLDRRLVVGCLAGEKLVKDDPDRVKIGARIDRGAARLLGGEVLRGADDRADLGHLARACPGDAEVGDLDASLLVHEHVVRLDVAVDDAVPVRKAERGQDLAAVVDGNRNRRGAVFDYQLFEREPLDHFHGDVVGALGLAAVVDLHDVGV